MSFVEVSDANKIALTPGGTNNWYDMDCSSVVPAGATGVVVDMANTGSSDYTAGYRCNGSTSTETGSAYRTSHVYFAIGVDANRIFEAYSSSTNITWHVIGYFTDDSYFPVNSTLLTTNTTSAWTDYDCSSFLQGTDGMVGVFLKLDGGSSTSYTGNLRKNGSTDDRHTQYLVRHRPAIVGVDGANKFEYYISSTSVKLYYVGYLKTGAGADAAVFAANQASYNPASTGSYQDITALPSGAIGAAWAPYSSSPDVDYGIRNNGSTYDDHVTGPYDTPVWFLGNACDANRVCECYMSSTSSAANYLACYFQTYSNQTDKTWTESTVPNCTTATGAVTTVIQQDRTIEMPVPGCIADDCTLTNQGSCVTVSSPTVVMPCPNAVADVGIVSVVTPTNVPVPITVVPNCVAEAGAVAVTIQQDRTVAMSCPDCVADSQAPTVELTIPMPCPTAVAGTDPVTIDRGDIHVVMPCPGAHADAGHVTAIKSVVNVPMPGPHCVANVGIVTVKLSSPKVIISTVPDCVAAADPVRVLNPQMWINEVTIDGILPAFHFCSEWDDTVQDADEHTIFHFIHEGSDPDQITVVANSGLDLVATLYPGYDLLVGPLDMSRFGPTIHIHHTSPDGVAMVALQL